MDRTAFDFQKKNALPRRRELVVRWPVSASLPFARAP